MTPTSRRRLLAAASGAALTSACASFFSAPDDTGNSELRAEARTTMKRAARFMRSNVPGVHIPDHVIDRLEKSEKPKLEGKKLCIELIQQIREIEGVSGIHVMAYRQEELVSDIISASGVMQGRQARRNPMQRQERRTSVT